jgi:hypothetical protein
VFSSNVSGGNARLPDVLRRCIWRRHSNRRRYFLVKRLDMIGSPSGGRLIPGLLHSGGFRGTQREASSRRDDAYRPALYRAELHVSSHFGRTTISDHSAEVTTGTRKYRPSGETSNPTEECNADLASALIVNSAVAVSIFNSGAKTIGTENTRPSLPK